MGRNGVYLLYLAIKLDGLATIFLAAGAVFFLFVWPLHVEIVLSYSISDPIKYHVYCSGYIFFPSFH